MQKVFYPYSILFFSPVWVWQGYAGACVSYIPSEMFDYTIKQVNIELSASPALYVIVTLAHIYWYLIICNLTNRILHFI